MINTVRDMLKTLENVNPDLEIIVSFKGGGGIVAEPRDIVDQDGTGRTVLAIYNSNGGCFGFPVLTEEVYTKESIEFLDALYDNYRPRGNLYKNGRRFTAIHGDYRIYSDYGGQQDTCYGKGYDPRIINRMVEKGLLEKYKQPFSHDGIMMTDKGREYIESLEKENAKP